MLDIYLILRKIAIFTSAVSGGVSPASIDKMFQSQISDNRPAIVAPQLPVPTIMKSKTRFSEKQGKIN